MGVEGPNYIIRSVVVVVVVALHPSAQDELVALMSHHQRRIEQHFSNSLPTRRHALATLFASSQLEASLEAHRPPAVSCR